MVKLKDISKECGVGISTVSRVLSGDRTRKIKESTEKLVIQTAQEMGYFAEKKQKIQCNEKEIKIVSIFLADHDNVLNPFFSEIFVGIKEQINLLSEYHKINYRVLSLYDADFESELIKFKPDIAILLGRVKKSVLSFVSEHVPNLVHAGVNSIKVVDEVLCEAKDGMREAVRYLASLGYTRIGYVGPVKDEGIQNEHRYIGYLNGLNEVGFSFDSDLVNDSTLDANSGFNATKSICSRSDVDSLVCANDTVAFGAIKYINENKLDIAVTGFNNEEISNFSSPTLTTFDVPKKELGNLAVVCALERLKNPRDINIKISVPYKLIERESTKKKKKS